MPNDRLTSFECEYELINNTAMADASLSSSSLKSFCTLSELVNDHVDYSNITLEHNYSVLDGSLEEFPDDFETPYFTSTKEFESNPYLDIQFSQAQSFYGITFNFEVDYPLEMEITLTNNSGLILTHTFEPDSTLYVADLECIDIVNVHVEFTETIPDRYIKIAGILLGRVLYWDEEVIKSGTLLTEQDPTSDRLSINTLDFEVIDVTNTYNLANETGYHIYFQKRQKVHTYEWINGTRMFLGNYFLDSFSWNVNLAKLNCVSYVGLLDDINYIDGNIYNGTKAGVILEDIFSKAGIDEYEIDTDTYDTYVYGTLKPMSCRDALREILFACDSGVTTTTDDGIVIFKHGTMILDTITRKQKVKTTITKNDYYSGVEVEYSSYAVSNNTEKIVDNQELLAGTYTFTFDNAYTSVVIKDENNNTITPTTVKKYYCVFTLASAKTITITGTPYAETTSKITVSKPVIDSGESEKIKSYKSSLCNATMARNRAQSILNYLDYRLTLDIQVITNDFNMQGRYWVENPSKNYADFIAWYTQRSYDLTGGFIDNAKMVGYYWYNLDTYYTGTELYAGEMGII